MCQFIETICIKDGTVRNLHYHVERMQRTIRHFFPYMPMVAESDLFGDIPAVEGLQKARIVYDEHGIIERTFAPYSIRRIQNIAVVEDNSISYPWKSTNRSMLVKQREKAPSYDEVIIVKNGYITDTSYTNLCFIDGNTWFTPDTPLLPGTMRQRLLDQGIIKEKSIPLSDLHKYQSVSLINAMMDLGDLVIPVNKIQV
jgi:4-amino-4-deoxychorismate lyase